MELEAAGRSLAWATGINTLRWCQSSAEVGEASGLPLLWHDLWQTVLHRAGYGEAHSFGDAVMGLFECGFC